MVLNLGHFFLVAQVEGIGAERRGEGGHDMVVADVVIGEQDILVETVFSVKHGEGWFGQ
jgi:hypothetical protein